MPPNGQFVYRIYLKNAPDCAIITRYNNIIVGIFETAKPICGHTGLHTGKTGILFMHDLMELWSYVLSEVGKGVSDTMMKLWFKDVHVSTPDMTSGVFNIVCPSQLRMEIMMKRAHEPIARVLGELLGVPITLNYMYLEQELNFKRSVLPGDPPPANDILFGLVLDNEIIPGAIPAPEQEREHEQEQRQGQGQGQKGESGSAAHTEASAAKAAPVSTPPTDAPAGTPAATAAQNAIDFGGFDSHSVRAGDDGSGDPEGDGGMEEQEQEHEQDDGDYDEALEALQVLRARQAEQARAAAEDEGGGIINYADSCRETYSFENFIVGASNKMAHAASYAVTEDPGRAFNPLFIYGNSGLGKTHLLYAITNRIHKKFPDSKILLVKGEEFTNKLIDSIRTNRQVQFRDYYRRADVLLIDDIQFIAGKDSTQEEFFHTFNALYEDQKQIIMTSDLPPRDIKLLEERLRTRFEWGLIVDIQPPEFELRVAIMKKKADVYNYDIPREVFDYLAENLRSNVRQMEGAIRKIGARAQLTGEEITVETAARSIADLMSADQPDPVTVDKILAHVTKKYGVSLEDIKGKKRTAEISLPRQVAIYLIRTMTDNSYPNIGKIFGRDHTTIMSSMRTMENEIKQNSLFEIEINDLMKQIRK